MTPENIEAPGARLTLYRDAPSWEAQTTAAIGKLKFDTAETGTALLLDLSDRLRGDGVTRLIGPMEGDTWHTYRTVIESDGSAPFLMEPRSSPHDLTALVAAGFIGISDYFSARAPLPEAIGQAPEGPAPEVRTWDGSDPQAHFTRIHALSCEAFAGNAFYKPIDRETFLAMYMPFVPMLRRELVLMAHDPQDGTLLGYLFGIPNYAEGPKSDTAILKTYASLRPGIGFHLAHAFHRTAADLGFANVIHALIHDANRSAERSQRHGATIFRRYRLLGLRIS